MGPERIGVRAVAAYVLSTPALCPGGISTTGGTGVWGVKSEREEGGAGETKSENLANSPEKHLLLLYFWRLPGGGKQ